MSDNGNQAQQPPPYDGPPPNPAGYDVIAELADVRLNAFTVTLGARWVCGCCEGFTAKLGLQEPEIIGALKGGQELEGVCNRCGAKLRIRKSMLADMTPNQRRNRRQKVRKG